MPKIEINILTGNHVQLEPLNESHKSSLYLAAQDSKIWTFTYTNAMNGNFYQWFDTALNAFKNETRLPFAVKSLPSGKILGSTSYYHIDLDNARLSIGYTWYTPEVWGTKINTECKLLLLKYAFNILCVNRVEFAIDSRNKRSIAAVEKLGAVNEGVLRQHQVLPDGYIRDTVVLSIIKPDWPDVQRGLQKKLDL